MRLVQWTIRRYDCATLMDIFVSKEPGTTACVFTPAFEALRKPNG
jgi:hypothetical protein